MKLACVFKNLRRTVLFASLVLNVNGIFAVQVSSRPVWTDPSPHSRLQIAVDENVQLEVLDWGGQGLPLVFLAGLGNTAHIWDDVAPQFTKDHHVYAITRRGFGRSSHVASGYSAERLADDVLTVMGRLNIVRPVLVGHSIAGEELSSIGTRFPSKVSGLIYLDAAYSYAFYDPTADYVGTLTDMKQKLDGLELHYASYVALWEVIRLVFAPPMAGGQPDVPQTRLDVPQTRLLELTLKVLGGQLVAGGLCLTR